MADGGVIIDDVGAEETRIWHFGAWMHDRTPMSELVRIGQATIKAKLTAFLIKYQDKRNDPTCAAIRSAPKHMITVYKDQQTKFLTIDNSGNQITLTGYETIEETAPQSALYVVKEK